MIKEAGVGGQGTKVLRPGTKAWQSVCLPSHTPVLGWCQLIGRVGKKLISKVLNMNLSTVSGSSVLGN